MSNPYLGQIAIVGFNFAPRGWALCDGQILPINQNQALFSLLGTTYGGDGRTSFALPDLRGRLPAHFDGSIQRGAKQGAETEILTAAQIPSHSHTFRATSADATVNNPNNAVLARSVQVLPYSATPSSLKSMSNEAIANAGSSQGHNNIQPCLCVNFVIALQGVFPSRN